MFEKINYLRNSSKLYMYIFLGFTLTLLNFHGDNLKSVLGRVAKKPEVSLNIYETRQKQLEKTCLEDEFKHQKTFPRHIVWVSKPKVVYRYNKYII